MKLKEKGKLYNLFAISDGGAELIEDLLEDVENLDLYDDVDFFIQEFIRDFNGEIKDWKNFFIRAIMSTIAEDFRVKLSEYLSDSQLDDVFEDMELGVDINSTCSEFHIEMNCNGQFDGFNADDIIHTYVESGIEDAYEKLKSLYGKYNNN